MTFQRSPFFFQGKHARVRARACTHTHTHTHTHTIIYIHTGQRNLTHDTQTIQSHTPMPSTHTSHTHTHTQAHAHNVTYPHTPKQSHMWSHAHPLRIHMSQCKHTCAHMPHCTCLHDGPRACRYTCVFSAHTHAHVRSQSFAFTHLCAHTVDIPIS